MKQRISVQWLEQDYYIVNAQNCWLVCVSTWKHTFLRPEVHDVHDSAHSKPCDSKRNSSFFLVSGISCDLGCACFSKLHMLKATYATIERQQLSSGVTREIFRQLATCPRKGLWNLLHEIQKRHHPTLTPVTLWPQWSLLPMASPVQRPPISLFSCCRFCSHSQPLVPCDQLSQSPVTR